mmetsp:Transcript_29853/g.45583  ORF Transcript_29853/g.45583 Transcript_29853/m.45583 type:complete len:124 (+) Transcript_29853:1435-1806(+)|eukprot:CAMPEP_0170501552 /NCGR_PEP_ID=MMETSP0208-20121228/38661_1 /TAXON_ID=197538 /ORGANISM="Strombidium inclinatum, Strain S3" /LENGTH=123 /DNA_ID=CAMNT_0010780163 /DNA_START=1357 /DNA_END=1728 /DNA_ORIENTATION=+
MCESGAADPKANSIHEAGPTHKKLLRSPMDSLRSNFQADYSHRGSSMLDDIYNYRGDSDTAKGGKKYYRPEIKTYRKKERNGLAAERTKRPDVIVDEHGLKPKIYGHDDNENMDDLQPDMAYS